MKTQWIDHLGTIINFTEDPLDTTRLVPTNGMHMETDGWLGSVAWHEKWRIPMNGCMWARRTVEYEPEDLLCKPTVEYIGSHKLLRVPHLCIPLQKNLRITKTLLHVLDLPHIERETLKSRGLNSKSTPQGKYPHSKDLSQSIGILSW